MTSVQAAVVSEEGGNWSIDTVELADPMGDELLVRVVACGVCHTDIAARDGHLPQPLPMPAVLGHEGAGVVEKVGPLVTEFAPGDHVVLTVLNCAKCPNCLAGHPAYCDHFMPMNFGGRRQDGGATLSRDGEAVSGAFFGQSSFATHALASERNAVKVPKDVDLALLGPLGCGFQTGAGTVMNVLKPHPGSRLAVFGTGAVGLAALMAAKALDCSATVAIDTHDNRLDLARELGATLTINGEKEDAVERIKTELGGLDFALDTTAVGAVVRQAVACLDRRGHCVMVGVPKLDAEITLPLGSLFMGQRLSGAIEGDAIPKLLIPQLIDLWRAGRFPFDRLLRFYNLENINQAVADSISGETLKPVLRIGAADTNAAH